MTIVNCYLVLRSLDDEFVERTSEILRRMSNVRASKCEVKYVHANDRST